MATANKNLPAKRWVKVKDAPATWVFADCNKPIEDVKNNFDKYDDYLLMNGKKIARNEFKPKNNKSLTNK